MGKISRILLAWAIAAALGGVALSPALRAQAAQAVGQGRSPRAVGKQNQETAPQASVSQAMTLQQTVDFALAHNPAVLKASAAAADAGAVLARDRAATLPTVSGELQNQIAKSANNGQFAQIGARVSPTFSQNTAALRANFNGLNLTNVYQARADKRAFDQANQQLLLTREQSTLDAETAFYKVAQDVQLVRIARDNVTYNRVLMQVADVNFRAGKVAGLDRLKAQVAYTSALEQLASAEADQEDARQDLAQLIGAPMSQQFAFPDTVPEPSLPDLDTSTLSRLALTNRPEVAIAQAQLDSAVIADRMVDAPNRPNVQVTGLWGNQVSPTSNAQILSNSSLCLAAGGTPAQCLPGPSHFYQIGLVSTWQLPLLDYGTVHAGHGSARLAINSQRAQLESTRQQVLIDVDQAVRRLLVESANLKLAKSNVDIAKRAADISAVQYKVGIISQTDVSAAQQAYLGAAKDLLNAQVAYVLGIATLKKATGTLTEAI